VISTTTVGYGDIYPVTTEGRILGMITVIQGLYLYTNIIAIMSNSISEWLHSHRLGTRKVNLEDHIVLCDYTALTDEFILQLDKYPKLKDKKVVVVSDLIESNPYPKHYYIKGTPFSPEMMKKACIQTASHVFIFSNTIHSNPDLKTIHLAHRVRRMNKKAKLIIELTNINHKEVKALSGNVLMVESDQEIKNLLNNKLLFEKLK
jgi:voltage-gated potassium channel